MKSLELSEADYARLKAAADADGVSPAQWIHNLLIKKGFLPPDSRAASDRGDDSEPQTGSTSDRNPLPVDP